MQRTVSAVFVSLLLGGAWPCPAWASSVISGIRLLSAILAVLVLSATADGAVITYDSRVSFSAGVSGEVVEGWDDLAPGTVILTLDGITYAPGFGEALVTNEFLALSSPNGLGSTSAPGFFESFEPMTFTFPTPIDAFGISIVTSFPGDGGYFATTDLGDEIFSVFDPFPGSSFGNFLGFSSDVPFTVVTLATIDVLTVDPYTLDDLNYRPATVPEPTSLLLLGLGTAAAAYRRRSARR